MAFNFQQCDVPSPLAQLSDEGAYHSEVDYFLGAGVEVIIPPFPQDIKYNQTVNKILVGEHGARIVAAHPTEAGVD